MDIRWIWLFLDSPEDLARDSWQWWAEATGSRVGDLRGDREQFATLLPPSGDPWVKLQAVGGSGGLHLDLDSDDIGGARAEAESLGARLLRHYGDVAVMASPGGFVFCLTHAWRPLSQQRDQATLLDQACLDIPADRYAEEVAFWSALTGWEVRSSEEPEFSSLERPDEIPVRLLLQRLDDAAPDAPVTAHPDLATTDRATSTAAHVELGAEVLDVREWWTVLRDPFGRVYCLTDRSPSTGVSAPSDRTRASTPSTMSS